YQSGFQICSETTNLDQIKLIDEFANQVGRCVVTGHNAVSCKLVQHGISVLEIHSVDAQPIGVVSRRLSPSMIARSIFSALPFAKSRPLNITPILREPLTIVTNSLSLASS